MDILTIAMLAIFVGALVYGYRLMLKKGTDNFYRLMAETNKRHGTSFGTTRDDVHTVLGVNALYGVMAFDQQNRKIAYVTKSGKVTEVLDFSYLANWQTKWVEKTVASESPSLMGSHVEMKTRQQNVVIEFGTNDLKRPRIMVPVPSKKYAEEWSQRLSVLLR